ALAPTSGLRAGLRAAHLKALHGLLDAPLGARVRLPGGLVVERGRAALWITPRAVAGGPVALAVPGETALPGAPGRLLAEVVTASAEPPPDPASGVWFDADALPGGVSRTLVLRPHVSGDRIIPFGGDHPVRVSRLLAAAGTPRTARAWWPLLVAPGGDEV